jgi:DNA-binding IclR family transcriptional regulator
MESGAIWDDPSEDLLFELLSDIERGDESFIVVEQLHDHTGQTYAQAIRDAQSRWIVERREGSSASHFGTTFEKMREAHAVLTAWAHQLPNVLDRASWERIPFE